MSHLRAENERLRRLVAETGRVLAEARRARQAVVAGYSSSPGATPVSGASADPLAHPAPLAESAHLAHASILVDPAHDPAAATTQLARSQVGPGAAHLPTSAAATAGPVPGGGVALAELAAVALAGPAGPELRVSATGAELTLVRPALAEPSPRPVSATGIDLVNGDPRAHLTAVPSPGSTASPAPSPSPGPASATGLAAMPGPEPATTLDGAADPLGSTIAPPAEEPARKARRGRLGRGRGEADADLASAAGPEPTADAAAAVPAPLRPELPPVARRPGLGDRGAARTDLRPGRVVRRRGGGGRLRQRVDRCRGHPHGPLRRRGGPVRAGHVGLTPARIGRARRRTPAPAGPERLDRPVGAARHQLVRGANPPGPDPPDGDTAGEVGDREAAP